MRALWERPGRRVLHNARRAPGYVHVSVVRRHLSSPLRRRNAWVCGCCTSGFSGRCSWFVASTTSGNFGVGDERRVVLAEDAMKRGVVGPAWGVRGNEAGTRARSQADCQRDSMGFRMKTQPESMAAPWRDAAPLPGTPNTPMASAALHAAAHRRVRRADLNVCTSERRP
jgi:hypothetical protein